MENETFENLLFRLGTLHQQRAALNVLGLARTPNLDAEYDSVMAELVKRPETKELVQ